MRYFSVLASLFVCVISGITACSLTLPASQTDIKITANKVADWQLSHMENFDYIRTFRDHTERSNGWVQAAFYIGLNRWYQRSQEPRYLSALTTKAEQNNWALGPLYWHADDQAFAQVYLALADRENVDRDNAVKSSTAKNSTERNGVERNRADISSIISDFDRILAAQPQNSLEFLPDPRGVAEGSCQWRWCWSDALFMAPPAWAALSQITDDSRYRDYALQEYRATTDYLFDKQTHLFYRDSRFFTRKSPYGNQVFWSRGNGWVFAGLPLILEQLPQDHPERQYLLNIYTKMAHAFIAIQTSAGFWASSLLDADHQPPPETSGTAFITFGLAWGVNRGILPRDTFAEPTQRAWQMLKENIDDKGRLGWVQQIGNAPDEVLANDTQLYGTGALLLAASEMLSFTSVK